MYDENMSKKVSEGAPKQVQILDCTLRDGGYYNDWDYPFDLVKKYLDAMAAARIDVVELGFRTLQASGYLGSTAYTTDAFIERLEPDPALRIAVMLNAKEILAESDQRVAVRKTFSRRHDSRVSLVRIAAVHHEIELLRPAVDELQGLGYDVALNLMQVSELDLSTVEWFGVLTRKIEAKYAYVADSFGALRPSDIAPMMSALQDGFGDSTGCHLHDNMSYALANTMEAVKSGVAIVDGTLQGMGRGPGNVRTEYLLMELARLGLTNASANPLVNIVEKDFAELKSEYGWGTSFYYFKSANLSIHPTYVMELDKDDRYSPSEIVTALDRLNTHGATSFDVRRLTEAVKGAPLRLIGGMELDNWCTDRDVLVVANGPEAREKKQEIEMFIREHQPFVIGLNAHLPIDMAYVDAVAACHPERVMLDSSALSRLECEVLMPDQLRRDTGITLRRHRDLGMFVTGTGFENDAIGVGIPVPLAIGYVLAAVTVGRAKRVLLVGLDGYTSKDPRHLAVQKTLDCYLEMSGSVPLVALTKTSFTVQQTSLFAPL